MNRAVRTAILLASVAVVNAQALQRQPAASAPPANLAGTWNLDRARSEFPPNVGFGMDVVPRGGRADEVDLEGRSGNPRSLTERPLSEQDARNVRQILGEVRLPPAQLVVTQTAAAITLADARGRSRVFHTDGRTDWQALEAGPMATSARWESGRFVVRYRVEQGRDVRYTFAVTADDTLDVLTELVERGGRDVIRRVYRRVPAGTAPPLDEPLPGLPSERAPATTSQTTPAAPAPGQLPAVPRQTAAAPEPLDTRPGAALIGLKNVGLVLEGFGPEAAHCGLREPAVDAAVSKKLADAGLTAARNRDEDSYVYVRLMTTAMTTGFCFSRYDAYVYTNVAVTLPHGTKPVMVEVQLLHKGGLSGSGRGAHGDAVVREIAAAVGELAARIAQANR